MSNDDETRLNALLRTRYEAFRVMRSGEVHVYGMRSSGIVGWYLLGFVSDPYLMAEIMERGQ